MLGQPREPGSQEVESDESGKLSLFLRQPSVGQRDWSLKPVVSEPSIRITTGACKKYCSFGPSQGEYESVGGGRPDVCVKLDSTSDFCSPGRLGASMALKVGKI